MISLLHSLLKKSGKDNFVIHPGIGGANMGMVGVAGGNLPKCTRFIS